MNIDPNNTPRTVDDAARQLLDSLTDSERAEFRETDPLELHFGIGMDIRNAWRLRESESPIHRDAPAREGFDGSDYDPLDGDSVSGLVVRKAMELVRGE